MIGHRGGARPGRLLDQLATDNDLDDSATATLDLLFNDDPCETMSPLGRVALEEELRHALRVRDRARRAPLASIDAVVIGGLPRTGTTFLFRLLATMTGRRVLSSWEAHSPDLAADAQSGTAVARAEAADRVALVREIAPKVHAMHSLDADGPEECTPLLAHSLQSLQWAIMAHAPTYADWLLDASLDEGYDLWARQLGMLDSGKPWLLKSPFHCNDYRALASASADLELIHIRRDAVATTTSFLNMVIAGRQIFAPSEEPRGLGSTWLTRLCRLLDRAMRDLAASGLEPHVVDFVELVAHPLAVGHDLASKLGDAALPMPLRPPGRRAAYDRLPLEAFGLTASDVERTLAHHLDGPFLTPPEGGSLSRR